jgi:hypothetical protein
MHLNAMCEKATSLMALTEKSVQSFTSLLSKDLSKKRLADYDKSIPIEKLKWAIQRILLLNTVKNNTKQFEQYEKRKKTSARNIGTFPSFESSTSMAAEESKTQSPGAGTRASRSMVVKPTSTPVLAPRMQASASTPTLSGEVNESDAEGMEYDSTKKTVTANTVTLPAIGPAKKGNAQATAAGNGTGTGTSLGSSVKKKK